MRLKFRPFYDTGEGYPYFMYFDRKGPALQAVVSQFNFRIYFSIQHSAFSIAEALLPR